MPGDHAPCQCSTAVVKLGVYTVTRTLVYFSRQPLQCRQWLPSYIIWRGCQLRRAPWELLLGFQEPVEAMQTEQDALPACLPVELVGRLQACDRGGGYLEDKGIEVKRAGGLFMIVMDTPSSNQGYLKQNYPLPVIHLPVQARSTVISYAMKASNPTAQLDVSFKYDAVAPEMAWWSSQGPVPVANGAVMKPDVTAPGEWK